MFQLVLDKKQIEEMLLLGLSVSGFQLANKTVTWNNKNGKPTSATVRVVSMRKNKAKQKSGGESTATFQTPAVTVTESTPTAETPQITVIPNQEMTEEEIANILNEVGIMRPNEE